MGKPSTVPSFLVKNQNPIIRVQVDKWLGQVTSWTSPGKTGVQQIHDLWVASCTLSGKSSADGCGWATSFSSWQRAPKPSLWARPASVPTDEPGHGTRCPCSAQPPSLHLPRAQNWHGKAAEALQNSFDKCWPFTARGPFVRLHWSWSDRNCFLHTWHSGIWRGRARRDAFDLPQKIEARTFSDDKEQMQTRMQNTLHCLIICEQGI
jgi:hypothetical protein